MFYILSEENVGGVIVREFVCDSDEDLEDIDNCSLGDLAIVVAPASIYLRNSKEKWLEL